MKNFDKYYGASSHWAYLYTNLVQGIMIVSLGFFFFLAPHLRLLATFPHEQSKKLKLSFVNADIHKRTHTPTHTCWTITQKQRQQQQRRRKCRDARQKVPVAKFLAQSTTTTKRSQGVEWEGAKGFGVGATTENAAWLLTTQNPQAQSCRKRRGAPDRHTLNREYTGDRTSEREKRERERDKEKKRFS